ncbi:hypothetical protein BO78DRAFT_425939 [Aspergillus sclerotiicarbonarius CBS 121057]|uniref:Uncharacterized protein n=1 Tax=Aspergillus sclerotiicarbonarius (strain CBS 121057 / IBT 28362) TaxID=1448318 RepID=A0A319EP80_ASPSB|nr:hypothetical protein BO78DRAFT_425939 [Aspergillus sclerotiicarbonarius CBS 121057]
MSFDTSQNQAVIGHDILWWPSVLWDEFPTTSLTETALRQLDYRNLCLQQSQGPIPRAFFQFAPEYLRKCSSQNLKEIKQLSRHGGPDLTDLRGYPPPIYHVYSLMPTESGNLEPVQVNPKKRKRAEPTAYYQEPIAYPQQPVAYPQPHMAYPQQRMAYPQQSMAYPQQPTAYPQQPMAYPQQSTAYYQNPQSPFDTFQMFHFDYPLERPVKIPRPNHLVSGQQQYSPRIR